MSKKIEVVGNFLIVTDTVIGDIENTQPMPSKDMTWNEDELRGGRVVFGTTKFLSDSTEFELYPPFDLSEAVDGSLVPFTESTFRDFCTVNLGKSSGGSSSIPTADIFNGGLVDYNDSTTSGSPITILAATPTVLTNDGAGSFTNKLFLPVGVTDVWDNVDSFDWSELKLGDMIDIRLDITLTTSSPNTTVEVDLHLGTGGAAYTIPFVTDADFKTTGTHTINKYNGIYMGDTNTLDNGGQFMITCDKASTAVVNGWYIKIIMKG